MNAQLFDAIVVGAGIAGATTAAHLAPDRRVALVEAEDAPGYHSTGRSAAMWILNYGPPDVRVLTGLSRPFFGAPPPGFADGPLLTQRPFLFLAPPDQVEALDRMVAGGIGLQERTPAQVRAMVPALRPDYAVAAAVEEDAFDIDVAALHQGFLRQFRAAGGVLAVGRRTASIARRGGLWHVAGAETASGQAEFAAPVLVNCAGAWGDAVAEQAGVPPLGLSPRRRTAAVVDPRPWEVASWPLVGDVDHTWYVRPEARTRLLVTPCDETPVAPHDVRPDELDIAVGVDRMQQALAVEVHRVERAWAGLRTFTPDRSLAIGWDASVDGFFWCVGQGGYGIQTSPAAGRFAADLVSGRDPGEAGRIVAAVSPRRFSRVAA